MEFVSSDVDLYHTRDYQNNHKYYNFLESDWSINLSIRALIGHLLVIGHLQSEIVIFLIIGNGTSCRPMSVCNYTRD